MTIDYEQLRRRELRRRVIDDHAVRDLDNEHLADWLAALRSGDYEQARGAMLVHFTDDAGKPEGVGYCCMGVACKLADVPLVYDGGMGVAVDSIDYPGGAERPSGDADLGHMPTWLRKLLNLTWDDENRLSGLNDTDEASFPAIADVIELAYRAGMSVDAAASQMRHLLF